MGIKFGSSQKSFVIRVTLELFYHCILSVKQEQPVAIHVGKHVKPGWLHPRLYIDCPERTARCALAAELAGALEVRGHCSASAARARVAEVHSAHAVSAYQILGHASVCQIPGHMSRPAVIDLHHDAIACSVTNLGHYAVQPVLGVVPVD